ncbi:MAG: SH3 domain-containing protein [Cognaticolwellia sp.]
MTFIKKNISRIKALLFVLITACFSLVGQTAEILAIEDLGPSIVIDVPYVELRSGPGRGYPITQVIEQNEVVTVLVKRTAWFKVVDKRGNEGWFHQDHLLNFSFNQQPIMATQDYDYLSHSWEAGVGYGELEQADFYRLSLSYAFSPVINTELAIGKAIGNVSDNEIAELMLVAQPFPELSVIPYFAVGAGVIRTTPHSVLADAQERNNTLISSAIGLKYYLTRNFLLRAEYKYSLVLTDRDDNEGIRIWTLGFSVFL